MVIDKKEIDAIIVIAKELKLSIRFGRTKRKDQSILSEFVRFPPESRRHKSKKMEIANRLKVGGKDVKIESSFVLGNIRIKPDIRYFENGNGI